MSVDLQREIVFSIGILFILILTFVCVLHYLFTRNKDKEEVKFIGGFLVTLIALYIRETWVAFVSLFIAGLIIASERFMSLLVAFIKGSDKFLTSENFSEMITHLSSYEIENKTKQEIYEIEAIKENDDQKENIRNHKSGDTKVYVEKIQNIEEKAIDKYQKSVTFDIKRNVRAGSQMLDGVGVSKKRKTVYLIEVKVFPDISDKNGGIKVNQVIQRLKLSVPNSLNVLNTEVDKLTLKSHYSNYKYILMMILVLDTNVDLTKLKKKVEVLKGQFNLEQNQVKVKFTYYNLPKLSQ